jgi:uncharacterized membrane protein YccC
MASSSPTLPLSGSPFFSSISSFWSRESSSLKQGIKTGIAGTITYAIYAGWNLPQGYWAVFAALAELSQLGVPDPVKCLGISRGY